MSASTGCTTHKFVSRSLNNGNVKCSECGEHYIAYILSTLASQYDMINKHFFIPTFLHTCVVCPDTNVCINSHPPVRANKRKLKQIAVE